MNFIKKISYFIALILSFTLVFTSCNNTDNSTKSIENEESIMNSYVMITDYAKPDTGKDVSDAIQRAISENPNKTIFFPDGVYLLSKSICTPATPEKSVSLKLANYATLKAADDYINVCTDSNTGKNGNYNNALVRLGSILPANNIYTVGSNYYFEGGIIDGSGIANGISIDGGRETRIANVSIKNTLVGLHVKHGANNGSSDADICNVNIVGNGEIESIGLLVNGFDNTFTNMRIARVQVGVKLLGGGNFIRNVHPLYVRHNKIGETNYADSIGFDERCGGNFYDNAYSDQFATGFSIAGSSSILDNCFVFYYANHGKQTAFNCRGTFTSIINNPRVNFSAREEKDATFFYTENHGSGKITNPMFSPNGCVNGKNNYSEYFSNEDII